MLWVRLSLEKRDELRLGEDLLGGRPLHERQPLLQVQSASSCLSPRPCPFKGFKRLALVTLRRMGGFIQFQGMKRPCERQGASPSHIPPSSFAVCLLNA